MIAVSNVLKKLWKMCETDENTSKQWEGMVSDVKKKKIG